MPLHAVPPHTHTHTYTHTHKFTLVHTSGCSQRKAPTCVCAWAESLPAAQALSPGASLHAGRFDAQPEPQQRAAVLTPQLPTQPHASHGQPGLSVALQIDCCDATARPQSRRRARFLGRCDSSTRTQWIHAAAHGKTQASASGWRTWGVEARLLGPRAGHAVLPRPGSSSVCRETVSQSAWSCLAGCEDHRAQGVCPAAPEAA